MLIREVENITLLLKCGGGTNLYKGVLITGIVVQPVNPWPTMVALHALPVILPPANAPRNRTTQVLRTQTFKWESMEGL